MAATSHMALLNVGGSGYTPPATSYANTGGSGNRTASIPAVSRTTLTLGGGTDSAQVDGTTTGAQGSWLTSGQTSGSFNFDFGSAKYIDEFKFYQNTGTAQGTWVFEGSNDNASWTQLGSSFTLGGSSGANTYPITQASPAAYRYYRVRIVFGSTVNTSWNEEWEFKIG